MPAEAAATTEAPEGRRAQRKRETRAALQDTAMLLFAEKGYDRTTVEEIADGAQVSPRTFFRYFASKEDVLEVDPAPILDAWQAILAEQDGTPTVSACVRALAQAVCTDFTARREFFLARFEVFAATPSLAPVALSYEEDVARQFDAAILAAVPGSADPAAVRMALGALHGVFRAAILIWFESGASGDLHALWQRGSTPISAALEAVLDGLAS